MSLNQTLHSRQASNEQPALHCPLATACTRLLIAWIINHTLPATMPVVGGSLVGSAAGEAEALGGQAETRRSITALMDIGIDTVRSWGHVTVREHAENPIKCFEGLARESDPR